MQVRVIDLSALDLIPHAEGTLLRLRVKPGARADGVIGVHGGALKISVRAAAEAGKANVAVCRLLADVLEIAPGAFVLQSGAASQNKVVLLRGLREAELLRRFRAGASEADRRPSP